MADETPRVNSLDIVRGAVMVLMAIDHVRVYSGLPAGGPTGGIFFTRWVTHFSAPAFAFLAGTAAFLHARKLADVAAMSPTKLVPIVGRIECPARPSRDEVSLFFSPAPLFSDCRS